VSAEILRNSYDGIVSEIYEVFANDACPTLDKDVIGEPCEYGGRVFVGPGKQTLETGDSRYEQSRWKYTVAHEVGHMIQKKAVGNPGFLGLYGYDKDGKPTKEPPPTRVSFDPPNTNALCRCNHVKTATPLHCLQSIEVAAESHTEGFAQFMASKAFNDRDGQACTFVYYKELALPTCVSEYCEPYNPAPPSENFSLQNNFPPVARSCLEAAEWRDRHCPQDATRTTEVDWMSFLWTLYSVGQDRFSMMDIWKLYGKLCAGSSSDFSYCGDGNAFSWALLEAASVAANGRNSNAHAHFLNRGNLHGVNENTALAP
jgi:hypothetical protein